MSGSVQYSYIQDIFSNLLDVKPAQVTFDGQTFVSIVPSDVVSIGAPDLVQVDQDGNVQGVNGSLLPVYLIPVVRQLRDELRFAKEQIKSIQLELDKINNS